MAAASYDKKKERMFQNVVSHQLTWIVQNVYMCGKLLTTEINGPDFGEKIHLFPWVLKLGPSTKSTFHQGISLFIYSVNMPRRPVNFSVLVRKSGSSLFLLNGEFQMTFGFERVWESPILVTNAAFKKEATLNEMNQFWEINIQLIWSENAEYDIIKGMCESRLSDYMRQREVGVDLERFFKERMFSDICINSGSKEIPAHEAILVARSPYIAREIKSAISGNLQRYDDLIPSKDPAVIDAILKYLYTGDVTCVTENGPLPIGIRKCAQKMQMHFLDLLTVPTELCAKTTIKLQTVKYEWVFSHSGIMRSIEHPLKIDSETFGNINEDVFSVQVTINPHPAPSISVFLKLEEIKYSENIYAVVDLSVKGNGEEIIARKKIAEKMTKSCTIQFPEFLSKDKLMQMDERNLAEIHFTCEISYSRDELDTVIENILMPELTVHDRIEEIPDIDFNKTYLGWKSLVSDLNTIFMNENLSDCTVVVGSDRFPAHRVILAARSPYFNAIINKKEQECAGSSVGMEITVEKNINVNMNILNVILQEIYTGSAKITSEFVKDIHALAKIFGLNALEQRCVH